MPTAPDTAVAPGELTHGPHPGLPGGLPPGPKLNLGCGPVQPDGWVNVDGSGRAKLAAWLPWVDRALVAVGLLRPTEFNPRVKVHNLFRPLPWVDRALVAVGLLRPTEFNPRVKVHNLFRPLPYRPGSVGCVYAGELWEHFEYPDAARLTADCVRVLAPGGVLRVCVPDGVQFWSKYLDLFRQQMATPKASRSADPLRAHVGMYFRDICTRRQVFKSMGHTHKWQFDEVQLVDLFEACGLTDVRRMPFHVSRIPDVAAVERSDFLIVEGVKPSA